MLFLESTKACTMLLAQLQKVRAQGRKDLSIWEVFQEKSLAIYTTLFKEANGSADGPNFAESTTMPHIGRETVLGLEFEDCLLIMHEKLSKMQ